MTPCVQVLGPDGLATQPPAPPGDTAARQPTPAPAAKQQAPAAAVSVRKLGKEEGAAGSAQATPAASPADRQDAGVSPASATTQPGAATQPHAPPTAPQPAVTAATAKTAEGGGTRLPSLAELDATQQPAAPAEPPAAGPTDRSEPHATAQARPAVLPGGPLPGHPDATSTGGSAPAAAPAP